MNLNKINLSININQLQSTQMEPTNTPTENIPAPLPNQISTTYTEFDVTRLACTPAEQKMIPGTGPGTDKPPGFYYQIPLMYNFGTPDVRILNEFLIEGCEMETKYGIQTKPNQQGTGLDHTIVCRFDVGNLEHNQFMSTINSIHGGCCHIIYAMRGAVKIYDFNASSPGGLFKNPVFRPRDEVTGEYIQGRAPSIYFKLFCRGQAPYEEKTLFTAPDGKPTRWELLRHVEMKFIPLIRVKRLYCGGGKASLQMEVASAVITKIAPRNTTTLQMNTIHRLQQSRPELSDTVAAQLARLSTERQEGLSNTTTTDQQNEDTQPTFSGITPTGGRNLTHSVQNNSNPNMNGSLPNMNGSLPNIPALNMQPNMQDFTGAAPVRSVIPAVNVLNNQTPSPGTKSVIQFN